VRFAHRLGQGLLQHFQGALLLAEHQGQLLTGAIKLLYTLCEIAKQQPRTTKGKANAQWDASQMRVRRQYKQLSAAASVSVSN
jgi:hypothetical protein